MIPAAKKAIQGATACLVLMLPTQLALAETTRAAIESVDPTTWGPYGVGVTKLTLVDETRGGGRAITTEVWYPADVPEGSPGEYYYHLGLGDALRNAIPIEGEEYPLVVFSHGNGGTRVQSIFYCEFLASHGYVVAAPDHLGNTFYGWDDDLTDQSPIDRPLDVTYVIDEMLRLNGEGMNPVPGTIDADKIGITGHSFGAFTSLLVSGAQLDMEQARADCAGGDNTACGAVEYADELFGPGIPWLDLSDSRVSVSIPQTPGIYSYFGEEGLSHVFTATAEMASRNDGVLSYDAEAYPIYQALPTDKYLLTLEHRGHYAYSSAWDVRPFDRRCEDLSDCPDRDPSHEIVNTMATAFLGYHLKGEAAWMPWLEADYYLSNYRGRVSYESQVAP